MSPPRRPAPRTPRTSVALVVALVMMLAAGCGVRLETPPPAPLTPGVDESARQRAAEDAVALGVLAGPAVPAPDPAADPVGAARAAVAGGSAVHLDLLGGLYDDGLAEGTTDLPGSAAAGPSPAPSSRPSGDVTADPSADPSAGPASDPPPAPPEALVTGLTEAADRARTDLAAVADPGLARLLASLWIHRSLSAARLAAAAALAPPAVPAPDVAVPAGPPTGLGGGDLATLVAAEDAAGYALEVVAAKHSGDLRARAGARAAVHRARAEAWAVAGGVAGTGLDPRRVAYALPGGLEDPAAASALVAALETTLAGDYLALVARVTPEARAAMADAAAEAAAQSLTWGAPLPALPGMPEHAGR